MINNELQYTYIKWIKNAMLQMSYEQLEDTEKQCLRLKNHLLLQKLKECKQYLYNNDLNEYNDKKNKD